MLDPKRKTEKKVNKNGNGFFTQKTVNRYAEALKSAKIRVKEDMKNGTARVKISNGNAKTGHVRYISLLPLLTCDACKRAESDYSVTDGAKIKRGVCNGTCTEFCFATRDCRNTNVLNAYAYNTAFWMLYPHEYFKQLAALTSVDRFFRWHSSGDITSAKYLEGVVQVANANPTTRYVIMTKRYKFVNDWLDKNGGAFPDNLTVILSGWSNLTPDNPYNLPTTTTYAEDSEWRNEWLSCGGNCEDCAVHGLGCFRLQRGETVAFKLH